MKKNFEVRCTLRTPIENYCDFYFIELELRLIYLCSGSKSPGKAAIYGKIDMAASAGPNDGELLYRRISIP